MTFTAISVLHGELVSAEEAIKIDHSSRANAFKCPECSQPVRLRTSNKRAPAYFAHAKRNTSCSLAQNAPDPSFSSEEKSEKSWSDEELFASVETYISMLEQVRSGNAVNKKQAYLDPWPVNTTT